MRHFYRALLFLSLIVSPYFSTAQGIEIDAVNPVTAGVVGQSDTLVYTVSNYIVQSPVVVDLTAVCMDCQLSQDTVHVPFSQSRQVELYFTPRHNINYPVVVFTSPRNGLGSDAAGALIAVSFDNPYYSSTQNLWEEDLKQELKSIISSPYVNKGYSGARDEMYMVIDNQKVNGQGASTNTLECVYTGTTVTGYSSRTAAQNQGFNTEHTFPQGTFNSNEPMRADLHHLFPTTVSSNGERGNKAFGIVSNPTWQVGGSKSNSSTFEPRDQQKGPAARAMLYFLVRYQNYQGYVGASDQTVLKNWALQYLPTAVEKRRNDDIEAVQRNRNPFVDYPQLIERISNFRGNSGTHEVVSCTALPDTLFVTGTDKASGFSRQLAFANDGTTTYTLSVATREFSGGALATVQTGTANQELAPGEVGLIDLSFGVTHQVDTGYVEITNSGSPNDPTTIVVIAQPGPLVIVGTTQPTPPRLSLYPNPVTDQLHWQEPVGTQFSKARVVNAMGQVVLQQELQGQQQLWVSHLPAGWYGLQLIAETGQVVVRQSFLKSQR